MLPQSRPSLHVDRAQSRRSRGKVLDAARRAHAGGAVGRRRRSATARSRSSRPTSARTSRITRQACWRAGRCRTRQQGELDGLARDHDGVRLLFARGGRRRHALQRRGRRAAAAEHVEADVRRDPVQPRAARRRANVCSERHARRNVSCSASSASAGDPSSRAQCRCSSSRWRSTIAANACSSGTVNTAAMLATGSAKGKGRSCIAVVPASASPAARPAGHTQAA